MIDTPANIFKTMRKKSGHLLIIVTLSRGHRFSISTRVDVVHIKISVKSYKKIILGLQKKMLSAVKLLQITSKSHNLGVSIKLKEAR